MVTNPKSNKTSPSVSGPEKLLVDGEQLFQEHRYKEALELCLKASEANPRNGRAGHALAQVAHDVHHAHRAAGADDVDLVALANLAGRRDAAQRIARLAARRADEADAAVVDAADLGDDRLAELRAALDDVEETGRGDFREKFLDGLGIDAEVNHVIEAGILDGSEFDGFGPSNFAGLAVPAKQ